MRLDHFRSRKFTVRDELGDFPRRQASDSGERASGLRHLGLKSIQLNLESETIALTVDTASQREDPEVRGKVKADEKDD
jgi:hypothetical protein